MTHIVHQDPDQMLDDFSQRLATIKEASGEVMSLEEARQNHQLARQMVAQPIATMDQITNLTTAALDELGAIVHYADYKARFAVQMVKLLQIIAEFSGRWNEDKQAEIEQLTREFLDELSQILDQAGMKMIQRLLKAS